MTFNEIFDDFASKASAAVMPFVDEDVFCGTILVAYRGKPIYREAFGYANREWSVTHTIGSKLRIGSITKTFTAIAIAALVEQGKLKVSDRVSTHYANAPECWSEVTIQHLLTHTSGIPSYTDIPVFASEIASTEHTPEQILDTVRNLPMDFPPGERFSYNNSGYVLLGYIVELVSGLSYAGFLQRMFFDPLGMRDTGYDVTGSILPLRAAGYTRDDGGWMNADYAAMTVPYAAGGLYSTVDDLLCWVNALASARVISLESFAQVTQDRGHGYGYGWFVSHRLGRPVYAHGGAINGFASSLEQYPEDELTVIVLSNLQGADVSLIAGRLASVYFGRYTPTPSCLIDPIQLNEYAGCFQLGPKYFLRTRVDEDRLNVRFGDDPALRLDYVGCDRFLCRMHDFQISFQRSPDGDVVAAVSHEHGRTLNAGPIEEIAAQRIEAAPLQALGEAPHNDQNFDQYAALYRLSPQVEIEILVDSGRIYMRAVGAKMLEIVREGVDRFAILNDATYLTFERIGGGAICGLTIHQSGLCMVAYKLTAPTEISTRESSINSAC